VFRSIGLDGVVQAVRRIAPGERVARIGLFVWARLIREAVADLLPFSQIGGLIVGTRVLVGRGVPSSRVYASMIADLTTEMASQALFTLFGLGTMASLLLSAHGANLRPVVFGGTAVLIAIMALFVLGQRPLLALAIRLAHRILPGAAIAIGAVDAELGRIYTHRRRLLLSFLFNLAGWTASAAGAWILLRLIAAPLPFVWVVAIESLIFTVRSVAFAVPGAIGFQEAAYVLLGPLFGLPAEIALALSIIKRARDIAIGCAALLIWQAYEARAVLVRR
jgi:putative membrane protein